MAKAASITSGLLIKKGEAIPSGTLSEPSKSQSNPAKVKGPSYYKALTVKLDHQRYEALKFAGIKLNRKSQEIFVEALDLWLATKGEPS